jgi:hypothetical protein
MKTCNSCLHWRQSPELHCPPLKGACMKLLEHNGHKLRVHSTDFCSQHILVEECHKEPEHGDHTNLWASMFELQNKVQDLGLKIDVHSIDESRHLRRPI